MTAGTGVGDPGRGRALRYGVLTSALVFLVSTVLAVVAGAELTAHADRLRSATERTFGTVSTADRNRVTVRWTPAAGGSRTDTVELAGPAPPAGTRTEVAYDPAAPHAPLVPGATLLADADRALSTLVIAGTVAAVVVGVGGWQLATRRRAARAPASAVPVRRVRIRAGVVARSWLETETRPVRWIPVHFDPVLVTLASPTEVRLHGDPWRRRLVAAEIDGRLLHPSGPVRSVEPRGDRADNPARTDATTAHRAAALRGLRRQVVADLPLLVPAPLAAALWAWVDGGGVGTWLASTALLGGLGLWSAALRGSDPS